jgi:hypothetical protein
MTNKQIQPVRNRDYQITQRSRPRGLWGQVWMALLQPGYFFRSLPVLEDTRTWLWAAVLILALTGISAVRQESLLNGGGSAPPVDFGAPPGGDLGGGDGGAISPGGGFSAVPMGGGGGGGGDTPFDSGAPPVTGNTGGSSDISTTWTTALLAGTAIIVGWFVLTVILSEVTLFNGRAPSLGQNFQIAIWASLPFAAMAGLQLIYYAAGGKTGGAGISGLLADWQGYNALPLFLKSVVLSLTSRLTIFWIWSLILIYVGARNALHGKRWSSALVVVIWAILLVVTPVITGAVKAPESESPVLIEQGDLPVLPENMDELFGNTDGNPDLNGGTGVEITPEADATLEVIPFDPSSLSAEETPAVEGQSETITKPLPTQPPAASETKPTAAPQTDSGNISKPPPVRIIPGGAVPVQPPSGGVG